MEVNLQESESRCKASSDPTTVIFSIPTHSKLESKKPLYEISCKKTSGRTIWSPCVKIHWIMFIVNLVYRNSDYILFSLLLVVSAYTCFHYRMDILRVSMEERE